MPKLTRRDFLKLSGGTALGVALSQFDWQLLQPIDVGNTHACRLRAFVRNGLILRSETNYDVGSYKDLYGNANGRPTATAHWNPRGCKKARPSTAACTARTG